MHEFVLGFGANLGDRKATISKAMDLLERHSRIRVGRIACFYESAPWGRKQQPAFINTCAIIETDLTSHALLRFCQSVERRLGRIHRFHWGPRTIDIDIVWWSAGEVRSKSLIVPHAQVTNRAFVLLPLKDILPDLSISGRPLDHWIAARPSAELKGVRRL